VPQLKWKFSSSFHRYILALLSCSSTFQHLE
jgi:hypothetical protein